MNFLVWFGCVNCLVIHAQSDPKNFYLVESASLVHLSKVEKHSLDSVLALYHSEKKDTTRIKLLVSVNELIYDYAVRNNYILIEGKILDSLLKNPSSKDIELCYKKLQVRVTHQQSLYHINNGDYQKALKCMNAALALAKKINYKSEEAEIYNGIALNNHFMGNLDNALFNYQKSLSLFKEIKDTASTALILYNIAQVYFIKTEYNKALNHAFESLKISEQTKIDIDLFSANNLIASIFYSLNDSKKAIEYNHKAKVIAERTGNSQLLAEALVGLGNAYLIERKFTEAEENFNEARSIALKDSNTFMLKIAYGKLAWLDLTKGDYKACISNGLKALKLIEGDGNMVLKTSVLNTLSGANMKLNNFKDAKIYANQALKLSDSLHILIEIKNASQNLKDIAVHEGDWKTAFTMQELNARMNDSLNNDNIRKQLYKKTYEHEFLQKEIQLKAEQRVKDIQLERNRILLVGLLIFSGLIILSSWLIISQNRIRSIQKNMLVEQKLLRSQMNPHFFFNCLQSISNFSEELMVKKYLSSFGATARAVLENSRFEEVTLKKEIQLLEHYFSLQKMLYADRFTYTVEVENDIDLDFILIPPMLCQPFIENAIEHGFKNTKTGGTILVSFKLNNDYLEVKVKDNGSGLKPMNDNSHQSFATTITRERIGLLNKRKKRKASFTITEAYPNEDNKGVEVTFAIPI